MSRPRPTTTTTTTTTRVVISIVTVSSYTLLVLTAFWQPWKDITEATIKYGHLFGPNPSWIDSHQGEAQIPTRRNFRKRQSGSRTTVSCLCQGKQPIQQAVIHTQVHTFSEIQAWPATLHTSFVRSFVTWMCSQSMGVTQSDSTIHLRRNRRRSRG